MIFARLRGDTNHMPRIVLDDAELAAVATYIRTEWGNDFGAVVPGDFAGC
jgi:mono/diheme cytochrome c family protein